MENRESRIALNRARFGEVIRQARQKANLSQQQLGALLYLEQYHITNWETGRTQPGLEDIANLCLLLDLPPEAFFPVSPSADADILPQSDRQAIALYRHLTPHDRAILASLMEGMLSSAEARLRRRCLTDFVTLVRNARGPREGITCPLQETDREEMEEVHVRRSNLTERAQEIVYVGDRSMEPLYYPGNEVFLAYTRTLRSGEIGLFCINGQMCIREYRVGYLRAKAEGFPDIPLREEDEVLFFGTILGRVDLSDLPDEREAAMLRKIDWDRQRS
ncbi:MAG: LexA family transcriptional regulator [Clostridia bacterium]|nr:LexA family transcriptional regulator [Clostridia bacterium]MBR1686854.1 LexA family transcriptional regulator [Clostridia bacterium]